MGKSGNWFSALKKVLSPKKSRSKKNLSSEERNVDLDANSSERTTALTAPAAAPSTPPLPPPPPPAPSKKDVTLAEAENEQSKHAYSVALATAAAAEAAVAAAQAAAEVVWLTSVAHYPGKSKEEIAAIRIQTAFRGYLVGFISSDLLFATFVVKLLMICHNSVEALRKYVLNMPVTTTHQRLSITTLLFYTTDLNFTILTHQLSPARHTTIALINTMTMNPVLRNPPASFEILSSFSKPKLKW